ncbi:amino acid ABC transporter permease [Roseicyclus mahoneyensis]|uniref:Amino acid ABC transporter membrane protein (PAAT family) n=1 Tax=Roseicyclus mahoneyensis TaxID=164332 RepID=A0A316GRG8_9RHOB|nr:amino acid ABC transporter permease [Roseicyclus mahoneyensis]PWK62216.1 amino acid ABC transporter membrane protein (PAAT family) [Roseicyclus mahoneyensis]
MTTAHPAKAGGQDPARRGPPPPPPKRGFDWRAAALPTAIGLASFISVFGGLALYVTSAEQWPRIKLQFFNLDAMIAAFPRVLQGFWVNIQVWLTVLVCILVWALVLAIVRSLRAPWFAPFRLMVVIYIDIFRGVPVLLLVLLFGFGIPALNLPGLPNSGLFWGSVAMVLSYAAYVAEIYRSGIDAVHEGQRAAAKSLGLSEWQTLRYAILPQALRNVVPALMNIVVALQKDVALLSVIGVRDAVREAQIYTASTFNYSSLIVAAGLFLLATIPMARLADYLTRRDRMRRLQIAA